MIKLPWTPNDKDNEIEILITVSPFSGEASTTYPTPLHPTPNPLNHIYNTQRFLLLYLDCSPPPVQFILSLSSTFSSVFYCHHTPIFTLPFSFFSLFLCLLGNQSHLIKFLSPLKVCLSSLRAKPRSSCRCQSITLSPIPKSHHRITMSHLPHFHPPNSNTTYLPFFPNKRDVSWQTRQVPRINRHLTNIWPANQTLKLRPLLIIDINKSLSLSLHFLFFPVYQQFDFHRDFFLPKFSKKSCRRKTFEKFHINKR